MPPFGQDNNGASSATRSILTPADRVVRADNGAITSFGSFEVQSDPTDILEGLGILFGVYGDGGNGKTTFICSLADRKVNPDGLGLPMVVLDAEAGIKSVAHLVGDDLQRTRVKSFSDVERFVDTWEAQPRQHFPWKSVYLDNLSDMVQKALEEQGFHNKANTGPGMTSSQPDYNAMTVRVTVCLQKIRDLALDYNVNVFFSLWEYTEKTESGQIIGYKADLPPRLSNRVRGILDYVGYLAIVDNPPHFDRKLTFLPMDANHRDLDAKVRIRRDEVAGQIPLEIYNPSMPDLLATLKGGKPFPVDRYRRRGVAK